MYVDDSCMNLGASRPAYAGSLSPVWEIASKNRLAWGYGVPDGVNGTGSNVSPALFTAVLYKLALCRMRDSTCDIQALVVYTRDG